MKKKNKIIYLLILTMIMITTMFNMMTKKNKYINKLSSYECGFNTMSKKRLPFSLQFYNISIIFLIFDMEIMIILPIIISMKLINKIIKYIMLMNFIKLILLTLLMEWFNKSLNWKL